MRKYALCLFIVLLIFTGNVFAVKVADLPEVKKPESIQMHGDDLFILEMSTKSILVYSSETFKLKHQLGKRGEGPGEFKYTPFLKKVSHDYVVCCSADKIIWYTRQGKIIKEQVLPPRTMIPIPIKDKFIIMTMDVNYQKREAYKILHLADSKYVPIKEFYRIKHDANLMSRRDTGDEEFKLLFNYFRHIVYDDKIFVANSQKGFVIDVFDSNADNLYSIDLTNTIERIKVDDKYKEIALEGLRLRYKHLYEQRKKSAFTIYEFFPPMRQFWIDDNKIYVTTYKKKGDDHELIILDIKGNILDKLFLPLKSTKDYKNSGEDDTFTLHKGILYELIDNEQTQMWELHKTDLSTVKE